MSHTPTQLSKTKDEILTYLTSAAKKPSNRGSRPTVTDRVGNPRSSRRQVGQYFSIAYFAFES